MMLFSRMKRNECFIIMTDRKQSLTILDNINLIPTVKFGKLSIMVCGCMSSKEIDVISILNEIIGKEVYLDISKK